MVQIDIVYRGELSCEAVHAPSRTALVTDAPADNLGRGASFSPTDLVATALGTCILTTMGIVAARHGWSLEGARARVHKHMVSDPARRIGTLEVTLDLPGGLDERARGTLEKTALTCPVHRSLAGSVAMPIQFRWADRPASPASGQGA
jgi:putative redox protein